MTQWTEVICITSLFCSSNTHCVNPVGTENVILLIGALMVETEPALTARIYVHSSPHAASVTHLAPNTDHSILKMWKWLIELSKYLPSQLLSHLANNRPHQSAPVYHGYYLSKLERVLQIVLHLRDRVKPIFFFSSSARVKWWQLKKCLQQTQLTLCEVAAKTGGIS